MNTRWAGSSSPCSRIQRRRALATSARSRSAACRLFFIGHVMAKKKARQRAFAGLDPPLGQFSYRLHQTPIWFFRLQRQYLACVLLQARNAPAAALGRRAPLLTPDLKPSHRRAHTDVEPLGCLVPRRARFHRLDHALPKVTRVGFRHRTSPKKESVRADSPMAKTLGIPQDSNRPGSTVAHPTEPQQSYSPNAPLTHRLKQIARNILIRHPEGSRDDSCASVSKDGSKFGVCFHPSRRPRASARGLLRVTSEFVARQRRVT